MKKLITVIGIFISLVNVSCNAQTTSAVPEKHNMQEMKQMLKDSLHLTDVQADSVVAIREEFITKTRQVMKDTSVSGDQRKEQLKPLHQEMKTRLKAILTKEQIQKLQELQKGMHKGKTNADDTN